MEAGGYGVGERSRMRWEGGRGVGMGRLLVKNGGWRRRRRVRERGKGGGETILGWVGGEDRVARSARVQEGSRGRCGGRDAGADGDGAEWSRLAGGKEDGSGPRVAGGVWGELYGGAGWGGGCQKGGAE